MTVAPRLHTTQEVPGQAINSVGGLLLLADVSLPALNSEFALKRALESRGDLCERIFHSAERYVNTVSENVARGS